MLQKKKLHFCTNIILQARGCSGDRLLLLPVHHRVPPFKYSTSRVSNLILLFKQKALREAAAVVVGGGHQETGDEIIEAPKMTTSYI